jgi:diketogulonate reductase-like aldo/keto reductase
MDKALNKSLKLKSGYEMPVLGLGTWKLTGSECETIVRKALEFGYRHIDTAELYENEQYIGNALQNIDRKSLFITSKVANTHLAKNKVLQACQRSLDKLKTDYLDLYLIHWPNDDAALGQTLEAMQQLIEQGKIRSFGLSNFDVERIKKVQNTGDIPISNLQIEYHPLTSRKELPRFCDQQGILITAYSPLAQGKVFENATLTEIAEKYNKSAAQVSLKWLIQKGNIVIPKASSEDHLKANTEIFDWQFEQEDLNRIDNIEMQERLVDTTYT